jgi:hypothetical protein
MRLLLPLALIGVLAACGSGTTTESPSSSCDLSLDALAGKAFVELEIQPDKSETPNPQARMMFGEEGGKTTVAYTVKNALHVYDYTCRPSGREGELKCSTPPEFERACLSLEANEQGSCTPDALKKVGLEGDAKKIEEDIKKAKERYAKAEQQRKDIAKSDGKDAADKAWKSFLITHNNVANPVEGLLYVKLDKERCRLQVDDMFATIYNGERTEDFNPVGTNAFVPADQDYLFEDCDSERLLVDFDKDELPRKLEDIPRVRAFPFGKDVYYHYIGEDGLKAEDGCTYSLDVYTNWVPVEKDKAVPVDGGKVDWRFTHAWSEDDVKYIGAERGKPLHGGFIHAVRKKTCGGKTEVIDTVCTATRFAGG